MQYLVFDECDTFIDAGYIKYFDFYIDSIKKLGHKMYFISATQPKLLQNMFEEKFSLDAASVEKPYLKQIVDDRTHLNLTQLQHEFLKLEQFDKNVTLQKVLEENFSSIQDGGCMLFCDSIQSARATEYYLREKGYLAESLHGDVPTPKRISAMDKFRNKQILFLVCTDLASRGLDFPHVNLVIQYDFPKTVSDYIHRAGRTGRGGAPGKVITFYRSKDMKIIQELQTSYETSKPLRITGSAFTKKSKGLIGPSTATRKLIK